MSEQGPADGQTAGDSHLGTVQDHGIGPAEVWADHPEGKGWVEHDQVSPHPVGRFTDPPDQRRSRQEHP